MSAFNAPREQLLASLRHYTSVLEDRKTALVRVSGASDRLRASLLADPSSDVGEILEQREDECRRLAELSPKGSGEALYSPEDMVPRQAQDDEMGMLARSALALQEDVRNIGDQILTCQTECELIMKTRLEAISKAIRESSQRRRLDAAYGPACSHETPVFLDRQR